MKHTLSIRGDMRHYIGTVPKIAHHLAIQDLPYLGARDISFRGRKNIIYGVKIQVNLITKAV